MRKKTLQVFILGLFRIPISVLQSIFLTQLSEKNRNCVLIYLGSGKGCFPYESVTGFNSLANLPENSDFWPIEMFYSRLRDEVISQKDWEGCHKLYKLLKMRNLSDFNDIYSVQDVYILGVIGNTDCKRLRRIWVLILGVLHLQVFLVVQLKG